MEKMFTLFSVAILLSACGCTSVSTITEYDPASGKVLKVTETKESIVREIRESLKDKAVLIVKTGWAARIVVTPADLENGGAANAEMSAGSVNAAYSSVPKDAPSAQSIAEAHERTICSTLSTTVSATASGISGSSCKIDSVPQ